MIDDFSIYDGHKAFGANGGHGIRSPDDHIAILAGLQRAHTIRNAGGFGGIDGDGLPCIVGSEAFLDRQSGGTEIQAIDFIVAKKVLRKFESLSLGFMKDELTKFSAYLDKVFGKNTMVVCKAYIEQLKKNN